MKIRHLLLFSFLFVTCTICQAQELKPRLVVLTDIGPADVEPDDNESAVRLLSYADRFEIEAICTSIGWNCDPYPEEWAEYLNRVVDAYETDVSNLMKRSKQIGFMSPFAENGKQKLGYWPSAKYIRSRTMMGSKKAGIGVIGKDNDSPGSDFLIKLADENDPRPIWVTAWGGANTLAQAIWKVKQTRSPEDFKKFLHKFRLYTITDQDMQYSMRMDRAYSSHQWLRREFPEDLMLIWDESAWLNQNELGKQNWQKYVDNIQGKGAMGKVYPTFKWGVEGDTPSFLHLMPNGLNDPNSPEQVGWGGYHLFSLSPDSITNAWTNWQSDVKSISDTYEKRFYPDEFNDFAARMAWAAEGKGNTNPVVIVNGKKGISQIELSAKAGNYVTIDASKSYDNEDNKLSFLWWQQTELGIPIKIFEAHTPVARILVPKNAKGHDLHIICEVRDNGPFRLVSYRRVIIKVE